MKRVKYLLSLLLLISGFNLWAQQLGSILSVNDEKGAVVFQCEDEQYVKVSIVSDEIVRFQVQENNVFEETYMEEVGFVNTAIANPEYQLSKEGDNYLIQTKAIDVHINGQKFAIKVLDKNGNLIVRNNKRKAFKNGIGTAINFDMPVDEHFFGFGFMRKTLDARGHKLLFTRNYRWKEATLPYFMSTRGYAFYSNSVCNQTFDFTGLADHQNQEYYSITSRNGAIDFFIIYGPDFPSLLDRYTTMTGKSMMVPKWSFGLQYRLRYYGDQEELLNVARGFRQKEIPCDIMALEPGWEETAYAMDWKWSPERFPNPEQMIKELDDMGFKLDLWESGVAPSKNTSDPKVRKQWYKQRRDIVEMGVRMFKQDDPYPRSILSTELLDPVLANSKSEDKNLTVEEHNNVSNSLYTQTLFDEFRKQTGERAVVMFHAYNASVASHRWPFQWAGDFQAENGMLNASLSGHAMVSYDIRNPYAAGWHQGFFTPFSVVDAWAYYRDPWLYSESIEQSHRTYACLRSRLVPYFYSSLWQSTQTGLPIERPMVLDYHADPMTHHMKSQFMVGDWFLLALSDVDDSPSGEKIDFWTGKQKGNNGRAYLPKGKWINYWSGKEENIKTAQWVYDEWPEYLGGLLYVKAGAIIPMGQVKNHVGETEDNIVVLDIYPEGKSSYKLYEDDGITYDYEKGKSALTTITSNKVDAEVTVNISKREGAYKGMPEARSFLVKIHATFCPNKVVVDGEVLKQFADAKALINKADTKGWYYDAKAKKAIIKLDKGWNYKVAEDGLDPLATIPLTAKNERIEIANAANLQDKAREIKVKLPTQAIPQFSTNIRALPADGVSQALINMVFANCSAPISEFKVTLEGEARFVDGASAIDMKGDAIDNLAIIAKSKAGKAKLTVSGKGIQTTSFEIPIYGEAAKLMIEESPVPLIGDGSHSKKIWVYLYDELGNTIEQSPTPIILNCDGTANFKQQEIYVKNGRAEVDIYAKNEIGIFNLDAAYKGTLSQSIRTRTVEGKMQVRINPPEKIKLGSDGDWIPDSVDVFVNFKVGDKLIREIEKTITLNVYNKQGELLDTYQKDTEKGEVIFKDITYYKRPAQCMFEIKCKGYDTVKRKVFANTWDLPQDYKEKKMYWHD